MPKKDKKKGKKKDKKQKKSAAPMPVVKKIELTDKSGPALVKAIRDFIAEGANKIPGSEFTFLTPRGVVFVKVNEKRTTWKLNDKSVATATFNNLFCETETDKSLYGKYKVPTPDTGKGKKKDKLPKKGSKSLPSEELLTQKQMEKKVKKAKKDKKGSKSELLLTQDQLGQEYKKKTFLAWLDFSQYGKKKQRKKLSLEFFPDKKHTGAEFLSDMKFVFGEEMPEADIFHCFEWMDNN